MRNMSEYMVTIDSIYPDGHARESVFRDNGDMVSPAVDERPKGALHRLIDGFRRWYVRRRSRLALRELDDSQLRDIGVTRREADLEVRKSIFLFP